MLRSSVMALAALLLAVVLAPAQAMAGEYSAAVGTEGGTSTAAGSWSPRLPASMNTRPTIQTAPFCAGWCRRRWGRSGSWCRSASKASAAGKNKRPGAIPKDGSAHPAPYTRKRHRHYANVPETADAGFRSALPLWSCPEWAMKGERPAQRRTPAAKTAGVRRRVIEGEGLGGFARRLYSIRVLPGGSGVTHNFFSRHAGWLGPGSRPFVPGRTNA